MSSEQDYPKIIAHRFSADRAITSREEDQLGRTRFAESLGAAIREWKGKDSLVVALYGVWGTGKSSIKNMAVDFLRKLPEREQPQIVEFNPWQWAGQDELAQAFFGEIGLALGRTDKSKESRKRARKWKAYAAYLKLGSYVIGGLQKGLIVSVAFLGFLGIANSFSHIPWFKTFCEVVGVIAVVFAALLTWAARFSGKLFDLFEARSEFHNQDLSQLKSDLRLSLQNLKRSLLVVIDDVDRLSVDQTALLFQLVKANADFPNMVYLILFQRDIVERNLQERGGIKGSEFLEKIVQVGFDVPQIERSRLENNVLFPGLNELLSDKAVGQRFDQVRWGNLFVPGLRPYFKTLRDVHRFLATLSFHVVLFRNQFTFEVNPIDLIGLDVFRVFEPSVYKALYDAKRLLTIPRGSALNRVLNDEEMKSYIEGIVRLGSEAHQSEIRAILKNLFPYTEWVFGGTSYGSGWEDKWFRDLRICHEDVFDRYFVLTIPEGDIPQANIERVLSFAGDRAKLVTEFQFHKEKGSLGVLLDRLEDYKQRIDPRFGVPFLTALFDVGDELPEESGGMFYMSAEMHAGRIVYWFLKQLSAPEARGEILKEAVKASSGIFLPVMVTSHDEEKQGETRTPEECIVNDDDLETLKGLCVEKIRAAARSGFLRTHRKLENILYRWREWTSEQEVKEWVKELVETEDGLLCFLEGFLGSVRSHGLEDYVVKQRWVIRLKEVETFAAVDDLTKKVETLSAQNLSPRQQDAVKAFRRAIERRKLGKADDGFGAWEED